MYFEFMIKTPNNCHCLWKDGIRTLLLPVKIVGQINANEDPSGGGVNAHVISGVVKVFGACVSLDVMRVVVTPAKL